MRILSVFFTGMFVAGALSTTWWLILGAGIISLILRRSYVVLVGAVFVDLWLAVSGSALLFGGFYTFVFLTVTIVVESARVRFVSAS